MQEIGIDEGALERWTDYLLDHSLGGIDAEDRVMIKGERICWPLMEVLERKVLAAGGVPDVYLIPPNNERGRVWSAAVARHGPASVLERVPDWHRARYESMTKYIEILGAEDPSRYRGLDAGKQAELASADRPFSTLRLAKPWVLTLYPTPAFAEMEGMPADAYAAFIVRASTTDPRPLKAAEERIAPLLDEAKLIRIQTAHPDGRALELRMDLTPSRAVMSYGLRNFPDGEVFTSPDARSPEGEIFIDLPVHYGGTDIQGIYLKLEGGRISDYRAEQGGEQLAAIIETDDGSHRLGEVALGMNPGFDRVLKHPLFVEKVGGTLHIAIGMSYESCFAEDPASEAGKRTLADLVEAGVFNKSAQHVDIVADFRPGGCGRRVLLDERELVVRDNVWVPAT
ncbi:MAG: aminopeptidase [Deltaproteobacteria bacterium]|nr:aminopeptidase [Deltaproteobacteria bacterium]